MEDKRKIANIMYEQGMSKELAISAENFFKEDGNLLDDLEAKRKIAVDQYDKLRIEKGYLKKEIRENEHNILFILRGKKGAVVIKYGKNDGDMDLHYHAVNKQYEECGKSSGCEYNENESCYCDGRGLVGDLNTVDVFEALEKEYSCLK